MSNWETIDKAPKDKTVIEIAALSEDGTVEDSAFMSWDPELVNGLYPGVKGFWVSPSGGFTWAVHTGFGPTHFRLRVLN